MRPNNRHWSGWPRIGEQHLEPAGRQRDPRAEGSEERGRPGSGGHDRDITRHARAVAHCDALDPARLDEDRCHGHTLTNDDTEPPSGGREAVNGGQRVGLTIDWTMDTAYHRGRQPGGDRSRRVPVDQLNRHTVRSLRGHVGLGLGLLGCALRDTQTPSAPIARRTLELTVKVGPTGQARQSNRPLGRVAAHGAHPGCARP